MPESMNNERRTGIPDSVNAMRQVGAIKPASDPNLEAARNFLQPTAINKDIVALNAAQLAKAKDEFQPMAKGELPDIRMQLKDDENDPRKEELERRLRFESMYSGRSSHMETFLRGAEALSALETNTIELDNRIMWVRRHISRLTGGPSRIQRETSDSLQDARNTLKDELERLKNEIDARAGQTMPGEVKKKGGGKVAVDWIEEARKEYTKTSEFYIEEPIQREKENEPKAEKIRERIAEAYVNIIHTALDNTAELNRYLENLKNPYPYDSRYSLQFFDQAIDMINEKLRNIDRAKNKEETALLKVLKRDILWAHSNVRKIEAMGPSGEIYFDGELSLQWTRTPHTELTARDFIRADRDRLPGVELTAEQRDLVRKTFSKKEGMLRMDMTVESGKKEERLGLREVAIDYQDAMIQWFYRATGVGQKNLEITDIANWTENPDIREEGEQYAIVDRTTYIFLSRALSLGSPAEEITYKNAADQEIKVPKQIMNPMCMPKTDEGTWNTYVTRMHELVVNWGFYESELKRISGMTNLADQEAAINNLVNGADGLIPKAQERQSRWEELNEEGPLSRLADEIIRAQINIEKGVLSGGDMGWTWKVEEKVALVPASDARGVYVVVKKYYQDKTPEHVWNLMRRNLSASSGRDGVRDFVEIRAYKDEITDDEWESYVTGGGIVRESEMGSIYENNDITTVAFIGRHLVDYDALAETRGTGIIFFPSNHGYRRRWKSEPPYFRPKVEEFAPKDSQLLSRLGIDLDGKRTVEGGILSENNPLENIVARRGYEKGKVGERGQKFGIFDPRAQDFAYHHVWAWQTPFLDKPGEADSEYLTMPIFMPTTLPIGFWRGVALDKPSAKISGGENESVWHQRLRGVRNSKMAWENMDRYKYSWIRVSHDQLERWLGPMITPHEGNRSTEGEYEKHYTKPSGAAEKEQGKRARLAGRMFEYIDGAIRATGLAQNKILAAFKVAGIMGIDIKSESTVKNEMSVLQADWVSPWINDMLDMPTKVREIYNYGGTSAQVALFTYMQARKIIESWIFMTQDQPDMVSKTITSLIDGDTF